MVGGTDLDREARLDSDDDAVRRLENRAKFFEWRNLNKFCRVTSFWVSGVLSLR